MGHKTEKPKQVSQGVDEQFIDLGTIKKGDLFPHSLIEYDQASIDKFRTAFYKIYPEELLGMRGVFPGGEADGCVEFDWKFEGGLIFCADINVDTMKVTYCKCKIEQSGDYYLWEEDTPLINFWSCILDVQNQAGLLGNGKRASHIAEKARRHIMHDEKLKARATQTSV